MLFVDEVHRFNKGQQDAFCRTLRTAPCFIGATTENPSFEVNSALLSRLRIYRLKAVKAEAIIGMLERTMASCYPDISATDAFTRGLAQIADGDVRQSLNLLELSMQVASANGKDVILDESLLTDLMETGSRRFDKGGDQFYEQISALHKSVRGSDPDAALYWFARMMDGGCDPSTWLDDVFAWRQKTLDC